MDFIIDTAGDDELTLKTELNERDNFYREKENRTQSILDLLEKKKEELDKNKEAEENIQNKLKVLKIDTLFDKFFDDMKWSYSVVVKHKDKKKFRFEQLDVETGTLKSKLGSVDVEKEMQNSVLKPGIEKEHCLPNYNISDRRLKALRKKEREKNKGPDWYNLPAPEITEELKNDLQILKMRSALDPKHFYKKNDMEVLPKYFQVGKIMDSPLDHVNERLTRKERKRTMVDELLADAEFQKYNKKKYKEIVDDKRKREYRTFMKDKRKKNKAELKKSKLNVKKKAKSK
ncbi:deoxynucleotidyltransferase terminal-interacting protein 2 [Plodia interpunctella]|uniref:deoxynucleotidyltransferase terminal-interacting protein 2 n=1 Tax=Plodia interpunctella TaxID=58824 RepID=UPI0023677B94|nr:deoxynucleotidyltransferase terminal-interacting protein 2 [Plodia interpunctella]